MTGEIGKIMFNCIWKGENKVTLSAIINDTEKEGLKKRDSSGLNFVFKEIC